MTKHKKFTVKIYQWKSAILALIVATILMMGLNPAGALAQCGGGHSGNMGGQQMMGASGQMGSGQMGMYGTQTPVQPDPNAITPGYVAPAPGYTMPQDPGGYGQMRGQGGTASGHMGH
jgi:hypothetical protein